MKLLAYGKQQDTGVGETNDERVFTFLDLELDLASSAVAVLRHGTLVVAGEHDEHEEERRQELHAERLALGHVTSWYRTSARRTPAPLLLLQYY